ncbi:MAG: hypothetical protein PHC88_13745 [Terrimicrobiaceae bacterium]|nr:hypothetical protein [Terrimicrobiaceae bacterium]
MPKQQPGPDATPASDGAILVSEERLRFKRRLKRVSLLVVLIVVAAHFLVGLGAGFLVVARYFAKPKAQFTSVKQVEMKPEDRQHRVALDQLESMRPKPTLNNRIQSLKPTTLTLPELPKAPVNTDIPIDTSAIVTGQIDGLGQSGSGTGSGTSGGFFGGAGKAGSGLLEGSFYDLKQTRAGSNTGMTTEEYKKVLRQVVEKGDPILKRYYVAPGKLYLTKIEIPTMNAEAAPAAFNVQNKVQPKMWLAVYKARVIAPASGKFQFKGGADDIILVWFNNQFVFDGSIIEVSPLFRKPGVEFTTIRGKTYDMTVMVGECPGGNFNAALQIQKMDGTPPYWFRMVADRSNKEKGPSGPIWRPAPTLNTPSSLTGVGL